MSMERIWIELEHRYMDAMVKNCEQIGVLKERIEWLERRIESVEKPKSNKGRVIKIDFRK